MKIHIEDYKGQTIEYDDDSDKFCCDISVEDQAKSAKRGSLKDVRREIDLFVKANLEFKPFKALYQEGGRDIRVIAFDSIRTDGKLVKAKGDYGWTSHYGAKEAQHVHVYVDTILDDLKALNDLQERQRLERNKELDKLVARLVKMDLSKYDLK